MPQSVLTRKRSTIARIAILAMVFSLMAVALPASAHSVALDSTGPCPTATPSAGFTDIGALDATTQTAINCLFAFGITTGTSATTYSPDATITRWQMALFLVRQAADHGLTIPAATSQGYTDIGAFDTATQNAINQITQLGISKGTSSSTFSPNDGVTRWQMALFIYRTGLAAGVSFNNNAAHNEFVDIAGLSAEAMTAINALADTRADPAGHIALGTGLSAFSPNLVLVRWQMALFLTRLLAADNIVAASGTRVVVTPTAALILATGQARTYVATFKNADGTPYTGRIGIQIVEATTGAPVYNDPAEQVFIESASDTLAPVPSVVGPGVNRSIGVAGADGIVTFTVRHVGAAEDAIPVVWEDLDLDSTYETVGNVAPGEPFGLGGVADFASGPATEATAATYTVNVTKTTKASDVFEGSGGIAPCAVPCSLYYDIGDIFQVGADAATLQEFEDALSLGDVVLTTYDPDTADQSTFRLTDNVAALTVTDPTAATTTTASTYTVKGQADPGAEVKVRDDINNNGIWDAGDNVRISAIADADGAYSVAVPLATGVVNNFVVTQRVVGDAVDTPAAGVNVFEITQGASAGATLTLTAGANLGVAGILDPVDTITITFSEPVIGVGDSGDTITVLDSDGTTGTLTFGSNALLVSGNGTATIVVRVTGAPVVSGGSAGPPGGVNPVASIQAVTGFTDDDNEAINVLGSGAGRSFSGF